MARMRWMLDRETGRQAAVCLYCDTEVAGDPGRTYHCFCRTSGLRGDVVSHPLKEAPLREAA